MNASVIEDEAGRPAARPAGMNDKTADIPKILVVDDHALFRQGLAMLLSELYPNSQIIEAASSAAALESARENTDITLIMLDLTLEDCSDFETVETLSRSLPDAAIVIVSVSEDSKDISRSYKAGARGYIVKSSSSAVLRHALPLVLAGETYVPSLAVSMLTGGTRRTANGGRGQKDDAPKLTPRQLEILLLMAQGLQNRDIATSLGMLEGTVKVHVKSILQRLSVNNRTHAVVTGIRLGLVPSDLVLPED